MRLFHLVMYLFYRYYSKGGTRQIPYFSALTAVAFLLFIHIFQLLIIFNRVDLLGEAGDPKPMKYLKLSVIFVPLGLLVFIAVPPSRLRNLSYPEEKIGLWNRWLVFYVISSVMLLFALMIIVPKK